MDWRFQYKLNGANVRCVAAAVPMLAAHWASEVGAAAALNILLTCPKHTLYCPQELALALKDPVALALALVETDAAACMSLITAKRRGGGLAGQLWQKIDSYVTGLPLAADAFTVARPDLQYFVGTVHRVLVMLKAPNSWIEDAIEGPWQVPLGTQFHKDVLQASRFAQVPMLAAQENASLILGTTAGIRCSKKDRVLLFFLLFFGSWNYAGSIPISAPNQLKTAARAPWMTAPTFSPTTKWMKT